MAFKNIVGVGDGNRDNGASCFFRHFQASFFKGQHPVFRMGISGALRENTHGDSLFNVVNSSQNHFQSRLHIFPIQKETVQPFHPVRKQRITQHGVFGNIAGQPRASGIGNYNVKIAEMVGNVEDSLIFRHMLFPNHRNFRACQFEHHPKSPLDNPKAADIRPIRIELFNHPLDQQNRNGKN